MNEKPLIIAEIGNNHEGDFDLAIQMMEIAYFECGTDMVKFQAGTAEDFVKSKDQIEFYKRYAFSIQEYEVLYKHGKRKGIPVFFSVFGDSNFDKLRCFPYFKIAARQCVYSYIEKWQSPNTFISIPHTIPESDLSGLKIKSGIVMHCVSEYPAKDPMLYRIKRFQKIFNLPIGYSDHTIGIKACLEVSKIKGLRAIEKHFTLRHNLGPLRDHKLSATPEEMKELVDKIRGK